MWPPVPDIRAAVGVSGACRRLRLFWERTNSGPPKLPLRWSSLGKPDKELAAFPVLVVTPLGPSTKVQVSESIQGRSLAGLSRHSSQLEMPRSTLCCLSPSLFGSAPPSPPPSQAPRFQHCWLWGLEKACGGPLLWDGRVFCSVPGLCASAIHSTVATRAPPDVLNEAGEGRKSRYLL